MSALVGWKPVSADPAVASARIRCLNPLAELRRRGYPVEPHRPGRRYAAVVFSKRYDAASLREARALQEAGTRVVFDLCDNHFHYPGGRPELARGAERLRAMLRLANDLVASTDALADVIRAELGDARPVTVIGDAVEEAIPVRAWPPVRWYRRRQLDLLERELGKPFRRDALRLVWFGARGGPYGPGGLADLARVREVLTAFQRERPLTLTIISNSERACQEAVRDWIVPHFYLEWHPLTFLEALGLHHVALVPVTPTPYTRCKTNNRVATALLHGLAVVADAIPSYEELRPFTMLDDWTGGLLRYADPAARADDVSRGRAHVRQRWTIGRVSDDWERLFDAVLGAAGR